MPSDTFPLHGGPDFLGTPQHDFSTNANACGPCPPALDAVVAADASRYPDPDYVALREMLGTLHGVPAGRIVLAASASEFIHRITALAQLRGVRTAALPAHSYGDYAQAAAARGLAVLRPHDGAWATAGLHWACEPSSPRGAADLVVADWCRAFDDGAVQGCASNVFRVIDCAYAPLRLEGSRQGALTFPPNAWQLWTPNKALGMTGVRAAYAIAPQHVSREDLTSLYALAPSWPVGSHGVAMLAAWAANETQQWLASTLPTLRDWKAAQQEVCALLGWTVVPGSLANYFLAQIPVDDVPAALARLRGHGIKLRDCSSFGLPRHVRLGVLAPAAQQALVSAWRN